MDFIRADDLAKLERYTKYLYVLELTKKDAPKSADQLVEEMSSKFDALSTSEQLEEHAKKMERTRREVEGPYKAASWDGEKNRR